MKSNLNNISLNAGKEINFIDLGPGFPVKSFILLEHLKFCTKQLTYLPVNVSNYFLEKSAAFARSKGVSAIEILCEFEFLHLKIDEYCDTHIQRVFFLGLTFCNFELKSICEILSKLVRPRDICIICSQSNSLHESDLLVPYSTRAVAVFSFGHMQNMGYDINQFSYQPRLVGDCIQTTFVANSEVSTPTSLPVGARVITAKSYRNAVSNIIDEISLSMCHVATYSDDQNALSVIQITGLC